MNDVISKKLKELPQSSGVYLMLNADGEIIYVGKAVNLKNRVSQYFHSYGTKTEKTVQLVRNIVDFRYIMTANEVDALVLENNLIKKHTPKYNILLKDDKNYPFIKINVKERYPTVEVVRRLKDDGSKYFGPYMVGISTKEILDLIYNAFPLRSCKNDLSKLKKGHRPCLNSHIGLCAAPCVGGICEEDYGKLVRKTLDFLKGNDDAISEALNCKMKAAALREDFELAMHYRDQLKVLDKLIRRQISALPKDYNMDVFSVCDNGLYSAVSVLIVRGGKLLGGDNYYLTNLVNEGKSNENDLPRSEKERENDEIIAEDFNGNMLSQFIQQYYQQSAVLPDEIVINRTLDMQNALEKLIFERYNKKVNIICPHQGVRKQLVEMAENNAKNYLETFIVKMVKKQSMTVGAVSDLCEKLNLQRKPNRIECYDISHISGTDKVASMVVFVNGEPSRKMYRRFKIKTVEGNNDFACMKECLLRRFLRLKSSDDGSFSAVPDLVVIDGGKGQLKYAQEAMEEADVTVPMISLAKREEEVFLPDVPDSVLLPRRSLALSLLQRVRDEAHRFAIEYHRKLRNKHIEFSVLKTVKGIGDKKVASLYEAFSTFTALKSATEAELAAVKGVSAADARALREFFNDTEIKK